MPHWIHRVVRASVFWYSVQDRPRALWRLLAFLFVAAAVANPLILLLDQSDSPFLESTLENVLTAAGFVVGLLFAARWLDRRPLRDFGIAVSGEWCRELAVGALLGGTIMTLAAAMLALTGSVAPGPSLRTDIVGTTVGVAIVGQGIRYAGGSLFEELFSRSYLLRMIAETVAGRRLGPTGAVALAAAVTSVMFGLLHGASPGSTWLAIANLTLLGALFALPMIVTGRLAASIGLHWGWNVTMNNLFGLPNGGRLSRATVTTLQDAGPDVWTGGAFGPEGGLVGTAAIAAGFGIVGLWLRRRGPVRIDAALADPPSTAPRTAT